VDPAVSGRPYRTSWLASYRDEEAARTEPWNCLARYHERGEMQLIEVDDTEWVSEPVFAPRASRSGEGDGYVLSLVRDRRTGASAVVVLDAARPGDGPVARAHFDHPMPPTLHGAWVAGGGPGTP
jgi:carotenoid cleavage dioxygenase-like enzyme